MNDLLHVALAIIVIEYGVARFGWRRTLTIFFAGFAGDVAMRWLS